MVPFCSLFITVTMIYNTPWFIQFIFPLGSQPLWPTLPTSFGTLYFTVHSVMHVDTFALIRVPTLFCQRNSRSFFHFFKVSLNIPNELRDSLNHSLNINWTGIAYYILSTLHVHVCLVEPLWDKLYWRRTIILIYLMIYYRLASKVGEGYTCSNGSVFPSVIIKWGYMA
jgi:hypothetical protein